MWTNWWRYSPTSSTFPVQVEVPSCFKKTAINPIPKKTHPMCLNDYCPVALTSIIMKWFEELVMANINSSLPPCLDPLPFAYQHNRSTDDAISLDLHSFLEHLDNKDTYQTPALGLVMWCNENNLSFDVSKNKELNIVFRKKGGEHAPTYINGTEVETVKSIKFLGVTITNDLSWTSHIDVTVKKAQQHRFVRKFGTSIRSLTIESILSGYIMAWYGNCSAQDRKKLQKVV
eukprot:g20035.t1